MKETAGNNFHNYTFEDFLQNSYFVSSVNNPSPESITFWEEFLQSNPANKNEYLKAKLYIETLANKQDELAGDEASELLESIQLANERYDTAFRRKKLLVRNIVVGMAAACLIGVIIYPFFKSRNSDIYKFAAKATMPGNEPSNTQLIVSDEKVVLVDEEESVIVYDSAKIRVGNTEEKLTQRETSGYNQLVVPKGKRSKLTLSDGTKVWVNAGTRVIYPAEFDKDERELYVEGEIFLQVAHNKDWPFVVKTKDIAVKVLGTEFNVTAYESDDMERVVLASGSVKITGKGKESSEGTVLSPNNMYQYDGKTGSVEAVDVNKYISWKDGMYLFENERLTVIMNRLSRYYGKDIECASAVEQLKCSGKLDLKNSLDEVLSGIAYTAPITYENRDGKFIINRKQ
jgi:hypothetical protein